MKIPVFGINEEFNEFTRNIEITLSSMRVVLRSLEKKQYYTNAEKSLSESRLKLGIKNNYPKKIIENKEINKTYIQIITDLYYFIDRVRAIQSLAGIPEVKKITYSKKIRFENKVKKLNEIYNKKYIELLHEHKSMPDRFKDLGAKDDLLEVLAAFNDMRNCLVHNSSFAKKDFIFKYYDIKLTKSGIEDNQTIFDVKMKIEKSEVKKGQLIKLTESNIENVIHVIFMFVLNGFKKLIAENEKFKLIHTLNSF